MSSNLRSKLLFAVAVILTPVSGGADPLMGRIANDHILPGFSKFAQSSAALAAAAQADCTPDAEPLRTAFGEAWDSWISVSHLRFGPTEVDNRAFSLGLWPDKRGNVHKSLEALIANPDASISDPDSFAQFSIAARGFTALEYLLYDEKLGVASEFHCALVNAVATDIQRTADTINADWSGDYGANFAAADSADDATKRLQAEVLTAGLTGVAFTKDARLGLPMGTEERPYPERAEAHRSERSQRHVALSIAGTGALFAVMAGDLKDAEAVTSAFTTAHDAATGLNDPALKGVTTPEGRAAITDLSEKLVTAEHSVRDVILPGLALTEGFNALDGD